MKIRAHVVRLLVLSGFFSLITGCAFGTRRANLTYMPAPGTRGLGPTAAMASTAPTAPGAPLVLVQFADQRSDKRAIGEVRNGWGMRTADVVAETDVAEWVTQAVMTELEKTGYKIAKVNTPTTAPVLTGDILTVYCTALFSYEGEVSFFARVKKDGEEILARRYTGKGSAGLNWAATSSGYADSLTLALANAIHELVADLNTVMVKK